MQDQKDVIVVVALSSLSVSVSVSLSPSAPLSVSVSGSSSCVVVVVVGEALRVSHSGLGSHSYDLPPRTEVEVPRSAKLKQVCDFRTPVP